jgi:hypothetical protein
MLLASGTVDWAALGKEAVIAAVGGIGVVGAFGLVLLGLNGVRQARERTEGGSAAVPGTLALVGIAVCAAALVIGFIAMTHKPS